MAMQEPPATSSSGFSLGSVTSHESWPAYVDNFFLPTIHKHLFLKPAEGYVKALEKSTSSQLLAMR